MTSTPEDATTDRGEETAEPVRTGDPAIDDALSGLDTLEERDVAEHPAVFEHVHRVLRDALSGARPQEESRQNPGGP
jgi:hypothetical protein